MARGTHRRHVSTGRVSLVARVVHVVGKCGGVVGAVGRSMEEVPGVGLITIGVYVESVIAPAFILHDLVDHAAIAVVGILQWQCP